MIRMNARVCIIPLVLLSVGVGGAADNSGFLPLFPEDGVPKGWLVRRWDDVSKPAEKAATWRVEDGVLHGSEPRGTWLVSEKEYGDFIFEFEWKLVNAATAAPLCARRFLAIRLLTEWNSRWWIQDIMGHEGAARRIDRQSLSSCCATKAALQAGRVEQYEITCRGASVKVLLNGEVILDVNLDDVPAPTSEPDVRHKCAAHGPLGPELVVMTS